MTSLAPPNHRTSVWSRVRFAGTALQVRLRFVLILLAAFIVVTQWPVLRNWWDKLTHRWWASQRTAHAVSRNTEFFCPMCPGVLSTWPSICPVCHMDLVPRQKGDAVILPEGVIARMQFSPYRIQLAGIRTSEIKASEVNPTEASTPKLHVPRSAVVDNGRERIVYVERMPGMFDGVIVELGPRRGDVFPVLKGLQAGDRVATVGAFLIDAEARLNPAVATSYFGAGGTSSTQTPAASRFTAKTKGKQLSPEDAALVARQKNCPVTELPLDSMGGPIPVEVAGRRVFICCAGCEGKLKRNPDTYLKKLGIASKPSSE